MTIHGVFASNHILLQAFAAEYDAMQYMADHSDVNFGLYHSPFEVVPDSAATVPNEQPQLSPEVLRQFRPADVQQAFTQYMVGIITFAELVLITAGWHAEQQTVAAQKGSCFNCGNNFIDGQYMTDHIQESK